MIMEIVIPDFGALATWVSAVAISLLAVVVSYRWGLNDGAVREFRRLFPPHNKPGQGPPYDFAPPGRRTYPDGLHKRRAQTMLDVLDDAGGLNDGRVEGYLAQRIAEATAQSAHVKPDWQQVFEQMEKERGGGKADPHKVAAWVDSETEMRKGQV